MQAYMITRGGPVLAACLRPDWNRKPLEIWPGFGKMIVRNALRALAQKESFHVFSKRGNMDFEYMGMFQAIGQSTNQAEIADAERMSDRTIEPRISMILKLEKAA
jgi:hypothetical protein